MRSATIPTLPLGLILGTTALMGVLVLPPRAQAQTAQLTVQAAVTQACSISAPNPLNFGTYVQGQISPKDAQVDISFTCGNNLSVRIDVNGGQNGSPSQRSMTNGGSILLYQLYKDSARTQVWGENAEGKTDTGTGNPKNVTIYGRISESQPAPALNYTDTVLVSLFLL